MSMSLPIVVHVSILGILLMFVMSLILGFVSPNNLSEILKAKELKIRVDYNPLMQVFSLNRIIRLKIVLLPIIDCKNPV